MPQPKIFMFSGQGSHYFEMGRPLYENNSVFAHWMNRMDSLVGDLTGRSVLSVLYGSGQKMEPFVDLPSTHPAIFMVQYALAQTLMAAGVVPDYTLGTSLGSFTAACVSGCLSMEQALSLVVQHAAAVAQHCKPGGMIAVLGEPRLHDMPALRKSVVAAVNFPSHFVLSAPAEELDPIEASLKAQAVAFQRLPVSFAFHSPWVDAAQAAFAAGAQGAVTEARIPMICCARAQALHSLPSDFFWNATRAPIEFQRTVQTWEAQALAESGTAFDYLDLGPSATLATFLKYLLPATSASTAQSIMSLYGSDLKRFSALTAGIDRPRLAHA